MRLFKPGPDVLTVRECANWMGYSTEWIRRAIQRGVTAADGTTVKLLANATVPLSGHRRSHRIFEGDFSAFLTAIGWRHIPRAHVPVHPYPVEKGA